MNVDFLFWVSIEHKILDVKTSHLYVLLLNHFHLKRQTLLTTPPSDKENQRNRQFEGKRVVDARKAGPGGEPREERNNQRNTEVDFSLQ